jgi:hypothetical protein
MLTTALVVALIGVVSYNVGKFAFKKDDQAERRAESFLELAGVLQDYGMVDLPKVLTKLAIKDYSGAYEVARFYVQLVKRDPTAVMAEFDKVYERVKAAKDAKAAASNVSKVIVTDAK